MLDQLEELARALDRAGARGPEAQRLLELAAVATARAAALEEVLAPRAEPRAQPEARPAERALDIAA